MVMVSVSETYDLSTKLNKMSLVAVHTPKKDLIQKTYPGLCMNSKYCRIDHVDVALACVSTLPVSPDQVGDIDGIAPQDLMNPILYKACSNDSFSTLEYRIWGLSTAQDGTDGVNGNMVISDNATALPTGVDDFAVYYSLLSNRDGFRAAMPQQGLEARGLVPLVFERYYNRGDNETLDGTVSNLDVSSEGAISKVGYAPQSMRGRAHPMPKFNTTYLTGATGDSTVVGASIPTGMGNGLPRNIQVEMPELLPTYLLAIVLPPAKRTKLFYRMTVRAYIDFTEVRPIQEITSFAQMASVYAPLVYHSDYVEQSSKLSEKTDLVDGEGLEIEKIMEGR